MGFDVVAPHYRWMEFLLAGRKLQRCRTRFLNAVGAPRNILLPGEGHGRSLVACCRRFPGARIVCLDASQGMLRQAARSLEKARIGLANVEFVHADILEWFPDSKRFDLIITNFFLDCFRADQVARVVALLSQTACPGANWLLADFQVPARGFKRARGQLIVWVMYQFFRVVTKLPSHRLTRPDGFLQEAGFKLNSRVETEWELLHSDWWTLQAIDVR